RDKANAPFHVIELNGIAPEACASACEYVLEDGVDNGIVGVQPGNQCASIEHVDDVSVPCRLGDGLCGRRGWCVGGVVAGFEPDRFDACLLRTRPGAGSGTRSLSV